MNYIYLIESHSKRQSNGWKIKIISVKISFFFQQQIVRFVALTATAHCQQQQYQVEVQHPFISYYRDMDLVDWVDSEVSLVDSVD